MKKHPSNRYERLAQKDEFAYANDRKIKPFGNTTIKDRPGSVRRKLAREAEEVQELDHELRDIEIRYASEGSKSLERD